MFHTAISRQEHLHAETASAGFFEFRGVHHDGPESLLLEDGFQLWAGARRNVGIVQDDAVAHKCVGFLNVEQVDPRPMLVEGGEGVSGESSGENQGGIVVQRTETGVEVVAVRIDEFERNDVDSHFGHCSRKLFDASACAAKTIAGVDAGSVGMPEQVAVAFEKVAAVTDLDDAIATRLAPFDVEGDFSLSRRIHHPAGDDEVTKSRFLANEELVGGEDHILEPFDGIDRFNRASVLLQNTTEIFPLSARFRAVDCLSA